MKTKFLYIVFAVVLMATVSVAAEVDVNRVSLEKIGQETVCKIYATGPFQYTHEIPEKVEGKPDRVLVDIFPAVYDLSSKAFDNLPPSIVSSVRSSQFAVSPEKVVRIVFDLKESVPYRIEKKNNEIWVYLPDKNSQPFPQWTSWTESSKPQPKNTLYEKSVAVNDGKKSDTKKPVVEDKPQMAKHEPPLMGKPTENKSVESKPENPTMAKNIEPQVEKKVNKPEPTPQPQPEVTKPATAPGIADYYRAQKSSFLDIEKNQTQKWVIQKKAGTPVQIAQNEPDKPVEEKPTQKSTQPGQPDRNEALEKEDAPAKSDQGDKKVEPAATEKKEKDKPFKKSKPVTAEKPSPSSDEQMLAGASPTPPDTAEIVPGDAPAEKSRPTSRFRRQPSLPAKLKGTIVAKFPTRMVIKYTPGMSRDPFKTLIDETKKTDSQMQRKVPDIETLRLVGVIEAANGKNRALLEDIDGYGYILGEGDKVKKGYVSRIDSDKAYFQLYEYGWSRTVALHLGNE